MKIGGIRVVDAKRGATITITANDVKKGGTKDPGACAAALACMRELHAREVRVHIGRTYVRVSDDRWMRYKTNPALRDEIVAFDRGGAFMPGEYVLGRINESNKLGYKKPTGPKKARGKKRTVRHIIAGVRQHGANH